jgi:hypothetical protein
MKTFPAASKHKPVGLEKVAPKVVPSQKRPPKTPAYVVTVWALLMQTIQKMLIKKESTFITYKFGQISKRQQI